MQIGNAKEINSWIESILHSTGISGGWVDFIMIGIDILFMIIIIILLDLLAKKIILSIVDKLIRRTKVTWDDVFLDNKVFHNVAHIVPIVLIDFFMPIFFGKYPGVLSLIDKVTDFAFVWIIVVLLNSIINSLTELSKGRDKYVSIAVQSLSQLTKIGIFLFAAIITFSILLKIDLGTIFGTLGALTAVLILVFRDTILGFVASIQMSASKMVKIGDWVVMPSYSADGYLIELNLMTAKIQNWDKTITSVPTYALISSAVKNWEGMSEAGVRRIKRSIVFDLNTVRFCNEDDIKLFMTYDLLEKYIDAREKEISTYNTKQVIHKDKLVNGRRMTNIGVFRKYAELYLENNDMVAKEQTLMVRQLQATEHGLPLEVYCFSTETAWVKHEGIQSDIFDHLFSVANEFGLRLYQAPSGNDILALKK
ncbi:MAG: mechanosensitive ion channel [Flavobacteriales bacterium]|nr:mechanosensitive ion channel [Flavobacteriales bacterium]